MTRRTVLSSLCAAFVWGCALAPLAAAPAQEPPAPASTAPIFLFRHANAPGVGDPAGFVLTQCATQRNLDAAGIRQAQAIGQALRERRLAIGKVMSSRWCRALDSARYAFAELPVSPEPAFDSIFQQDSSLARAQTAKALAVLKAWQGPGALVVFTHQVNVQALTGQSLASGEGLELRLLKGAIEVRGRVPVPPL